MNKLLLLTIPVLFLTACETMPQNKQSTQQVQNKPLPLVGGSIDDRLLQTATQIQSQLSLLNQIRQRNFTGEFNMVEHNNQLDARVGSNKTLPQEFAFPNKQEQKIAKQKKQEEKKRLQEEKLHKALHSKIEKIEWNNRSANTLARNFANLIGYTMVTTPSNRDINITFSAQNITVLQAMQQFQRQILPHADIQISRENKTITINYR